MLVKSYCWLSFGYKSYLYYWIEITFEYKEENKIPSVGTISKFNRKYKKIKNKKTDKLTKKITNAKNYLVILDTNSYAQIQFDSVGFHLCCF